MISSTPANGAGLDGFFGWVLIRVLLDGWKWVALRNRLGRVGLTTQTGWDGSGRYGSRSVRKSHIIFRRDFGLGRIGALGRRGGSEPLPETRKLPCARTFAVC